ncbi:MAG: heavy-metal-associated domain-containing protein [Candidatus Aminicenantales bacterium]
MAEALIKRRKLAVLGLEDRSRVGRVKSDLGKREGIISFSVDELRGKIEIEYDLWKINFETIEKLIKKAGFRLSQKIGEKLKRGMTKFTEQNELDNFKSAPHSCCEDPKEMSGKSYH